MKPIDHDGYLERFILRREYVKPNKVQFLFDASFIVGNNLYIELDLSLI